FGRIGAGQKVGALPSKRDRRRTATGAGPQCESVWYLELFLRRPRCLRPSNAVRLTLPTPLRVTGEATLLQSNNLLNLRASMATCVQCRWRLAWRNRLGLSAACPFSARTSHRLANELNPTRADEVIEPCIAWRAMGAVCSSWCLVDLSGLL